MHSFLNSMCAVALFSVIFYIAKHVRKIASDLKDSEHHARSWEEIATLAMRERDELAAKLAARGDAPVGGPFRDAAPVDAAAEKPTFDLSIMRPYHHRCAFCGIGEAKPRFCVGCENPNYMFHFDHLHVSCGTCGASYIVRGASV